MTPKKVNWLKIMSFVFLFPNSDYLLRWFIKRMYENDTLRGYIKKICYDDILKLYIKKIY